VARVSEVARLVGLSRAGVMRRIQSARLPATQNSGRYWVAVRPPRAHRAGAAGPTAARRL